MSHDLTTSRRASPARRSSFGSTLASHIQTLHRAKMLSNPLRTALRALRRASRLRRVHSAPTLSSSSTCQDSDAISPPQETKKVGSCLASRFATNAPVGILASSSGIERTCIGHSNNTSGTACGHNEPSVSPNEDDRFDLVRAGIELEDDSEEEADLPSIPPYAVVPASPSTRIICPDSGRLARRLALYDINQVLGEVMARTHPDWMPRMARVYEENASGLSSSTVAVTVPGWEFDNYAVQIPVIMEGGNPFGQAVPWEDDERAEEEGAFEAGQGNGWEEGVTYDVEPQTNLEAIPRVFLEK